MFPRKCVGCGEGADAEYGYAFCKKCGREFEIETSELCPICRRAQTECRCRPTYGSNSVEYIHLIPYGSAFSKKVIFSLKRKDKASPRKYLAKKMAELIENENDATVTFAPRSHGGVREYGFDQAFLLAKDAAKAAGFRFEKMFAHKKRSREQKTLGLFERRENAKASYVLRRGANVCGKTVVIVDDVITSGSTTSVLCELVRNAGADRISVLTVAKTRGAEK